MGHCAMPETVELGVECFAVECGRCFITSRSTSHVEGLQQPRVVLSQGAALQQFVTALRAANVA